MACHGAFLEIEVTESTVMSDAEGSVEILEELRRISVIVAIDNFGTGYSSMSYLRRFPIDKLKIDRSFIRELAGNTEDLSNVRATVSLAHSFKLKVVAEGVETPEQLEQLRHLGCDQPTRPNSPPLFKEPIDESISQVSRTDSSRLRNCLGAGPIIDRLGKSAFRATQRIQDWLPIKSRQPFDDRVGSGN
jgi:predicted signal transduction protein with EAL and GGDEF domain